jgi:hypothetical protein
LKRIYKLVWKKCSANFNFNFIEDRPTSNPALKFVIRLFTLISPNLFTDYYLSRVRKFDVKVEYLLVVSGQSLKKFNDLHPDATRILYL